MEIVYMKLLQYLRENPESNTNVVLAKILLLNLEKIKKMSVEEAAIFCMCSASTLNRFCNAIGLHNFRHLKKMLNLPRSKYMMQEYNSKDYVSHIMDNITQTAQFLGESDISHIIYKIHEAKRILLIGYQNNQTYTMEFQIKMLQLGKYVESVGYLDIVSTLAQLKPDDFAIFISFQGNLFVGNNGEVMQALKQCKAYSLLISQISHVHIIKQFDAFIKCGTYSYFGEGRYSLLYVLDELYYRYANFLLESDLM